MMAFHGLREREKEREGERKRERKDYDTMAVAMLKLSQVVREEAARGGVTSLGIDR